jgi:hypothetical protein
MPVEGDLEDKMESNERLREKVDLERGFVGGWREERRYESNGIRCFKLLFKIP